MNNRKLLVNELRDHLLPTFIDKGFKIYSLDGEEKKSREFRSMFPFGYLKRVNDDTSLDGVEIQLDANGKSTFVINFGRTHKNEFITPMGSILTRDKITSVSMEKSYRLYDSIFFKTWFGNKIFRKNENPEQLVKRAIIYSQEIHNWFNNEDLGAHIK